MGDDDFWGRMDASVDRRPERMETITPLHPSSYLNEIIHEQIHRRSERLGKFMLRAIGGLINEGLTLHDLGDFLARNDDKIDTWTGTSLNLDYREFAQTMRFLLAPPGARDAHWEKSAFLLQLCSLYAAYHDRVDQLMENAPPLAGEEDNYGGGSTKWFAVWTDEDGNDVVRQYEKPEDWYVEHIFDKMDEEDQ